MDEEEVANDGIDESFEWGETDALPYSRPDQAGMAALAEAGPDAGDDDYEITEQEKMSLSPYSSGRHYYDTGDPDSA